MVFSALWMSFVDLAAAAECCATQKMVPKTITDGHQPEV
jgi:hypothetical protein